MNTFYSPKLELYINIQMENGIIKRLMFSRAPMGKEAKSRVIEDLRRYLNGEAIDFSKYNISLSSFTQFERAVLLETRKIPFGVTICYSELAKLVGTSAVRAVGNALAKNPVPLLIPCHRVIRKNGSLGGYTAGVNVKQKLLEIEGIRGG
ncbi:MAG: methylated-DNA--[protein]-cysteine S-methyltransferase [Methanocellales archaeon]